MAAGDVTVSNDAASVSALQVTKFTGLVTRNGPLPTPGANVAVAAAGNTVPNLALGDFLVVSRADQPMDPKSLLQLAIHNQVP